MDLQKSNPLDSSAQELALLGALLAHEGGRDEALAAVTPEMCTDARVRVALGKIRDLYLASQPIGAHELVVALRRSDHLAQAGGVEFLLLAVESCPNVMGAAHYAGQVKDFATRRRIARELDNLKAQVVAPESTAVDPAKVMSRMASILCERDAAAGLISIKDILGEAIELPNVEGDRPRVGIGKVDENLNFFEPGEVTVLAARPGCGKSTLMRQILWGASECGSVICFSLEVTPTVLAQQITCEVAKVRFDIFRKRRLNDDDLQRLIVAREMVARRDIRIFPRASVSALDVSISISQLEAAGQRPVIVAVDYLGLMRHEKAERQDLAIGATTRVLKMLAVERKLSILLLCQLNRKSEDRGSASEYDRPRLADLRDSGSIEQDADNIVFLWRKNRDEYQASGDGKGFGVVERVFTVSKYRNGSIFETELMFNMPLGRFYEQTKYPTPVAEYVGGGNDH